MTLRKNSIITYILCLQKELLSLKRAGEKKKMTWTHPGTPNVYLIADFSSARLRDKRILLTELKT